MSKHTMNIIYQAIVNDGDFYKPIHNYGLFTDLEDAKSVLDNSEEVKEGYAEEVFILVYSLVGRTYDHVGRYSRVYNYANAKDGWTYEIMDEEGEQ